MGALALFLGLATVSATAAAATPLRAEARVDAGTGFNLHVGRSDLDLDYDDHAGGDRLEVSRLGIAWYESPTPGLRLGLSGGVQGVDQSNRAATAGRDPDGYYAAFHADGIWALSDHLRFELGTRLGYAQADDGADDGGVELEWWSARLEPAATLTLADRFDLTAGVRAQWIDGDERTTGSDGDTVDFRQDGVAGAFVGLGVRTGNGGRVRVRADAGPVQSVRLVFERWY